MTAAACPDYQADWLIFGYTVPIEVCRFWIIGQACRLQNRGPCIWEGQPPPANHRGDDHGQK